MNVVDVVILIFLLIGAYKGFKRGLLMEAMSLGAFFVALILGIKLLDWGISVLSNYVEGYDSLLPIFAFTIIFIGIILMLNLTGKVVKKVLDMTLLGSLDDVAGSLMGVIKWALFVSIVIWIFTSFGGQMSESTIATSILYGPVSSFAPSLFNIFSDVYPVFMEYFNGSKEFINSQELNV